MTPFAALAHFVAETAKKPFARPDKESLNRRLIDAAQRYPSTPHDLREVLELALRGADPNAQRSAALRGALKRNNYPMTRLLLSLPGLDAAPARRLAESRASASAQLVLETTTATPPARKNNALRLVAAR